MHNAIKGRNIREEYSSLSVMLLEMYEKLNLIKIEYCYTVRGGSNA